MVSPACEALERRDLMATFASLESHAASPGARPAAEVSALSAGTLVERPTSAVGARAAALDQALQRVMNEYRIPGAVAGVVTPGRRPWLAARGLADVAEGRALTVRDDFQIRSVTKSFVVTLVLQLEARGKLSMSDPVGMYVPGIPNGDRITLADLAGMRSGVEDYTRVAAFREALEADPARSWTNRELVDLAVPGSPVFEPGARYDYSNTNTLLLGMVVERATGRSLDQALRAMIFRPLGLARTRYPMGVVDDPSQPTPYQVDPTTGELEVLPQLNLSSLGPAGAIVTSLPNLLRWGRALGSGRLIGPALLQQRQAAAVPPANGPEYDRYGLGMGELKGWWGHTGEGVGYQAATFFDPVTRSVIAVAVNSTQSVNVATQIFKALADVVRAG